MLFGLFQNYTDTSTAHCVKYLGRKNFQVCERIFWFFGVCTFISFASTVGFTLWSRFEEMPIEIIVKDVHYPLSKYPFPAVTICPANPIDESVGIPYLKRFFNNTEDSEEENNVLTNVISLLSSTKHPSFFNIKNKTLKMKNYLPFFDQMNVTDFMINVLPHCADLMDICYWHGEKKNCCDIFSFQRTEEGFCYAFNSLTSENKRECLIRDFFIKSALPNDSCVPKHITSSGGYSGLTVIMKKDNSVKQKINVLISTINEFVEAGTGAVLDFEPGKVLEIQVTPIIIEGSSKLISYSPEERECLLPNEREMKLYNYYTQTNCLVECRHNLISRNCRCQLYFFNDPSNKYPECTLKDLRCVANLSAKLRMISPAEQAKSNLSEKQYCDCPISCYGSMYDLVLKRNNLSIFNGQPQSGLLDIYFSSLGAVNYRRQLSFTPEELIVSVGGTGNLFLGCSFISVTEFLYYFARGFFKLAQLLCKKIYKKMIKKSKLQFMP